VVCLRYCGVRGKLWRDGDSGVRVQCRAEEILWRRGTIWCDGDTVV
jgi:hypothetical protein